MKIEDGKHINEEDLAQLDGKHEIYLIGEDFAAAEVLMKAICSDEWDILHAALDASKSKAHDEITEVELHAKTRLKQMCAGELNAHSIQPILAEVHRIIHSAHQIANEACDRLEMHKKEFLDDLMQMGARRLHSCLEVVAQKVSARKYSSGLSERKRREQQALDDAKSAAFDDEAEDSDGTDKLMVEMYMQDAQKLKREKEQLLKELSVMQHRAADAEASLEHQQKCAEEQLTATQQLLESMQTILNETREDAARQLEQKLEINELLREEMDRTIELQARIAQLENDTRAQAEIERLRAQLARDHAKNRSHEVEDKARHELARQESRNRATMLLDSLWDGAAHLAAERKSHRKTIETGYQMHQHLAKARARIQLQIKLKHEEERQARETDLSRQVSAVTGATAQERALKQQIHDLMLELQRPAMTDASVQVNTMPPPRTPQTPRMPMKTPESGKAFNVPPRSDPTNVAMWVNRRERCQVFQPTTAGFRRPRNLAAASGIRMLPTSKDASGTWATNSQSSFFATPPTPGAPSTQLIGSKLPSLPSRFGRVEVAANVHDVAQGRQHGRESPAAGPNSYNSSKFMGAPHCIYYNTTPAYAHTVR